MVDEIDKWGDYYANVKYGDLKEIWDEIHVLIPFVKVRASEVCKLFPRDDAGLIQFPCHLDHLVP